MKKPPVRILLGVTGSIAAYKAVELLRLLRLQGHEVRVIQTPTSRNFVGSLTFQTLSGQPVPDEPFVKGEVEKTSFPHIDLGRTDLMVIAPATATTIAKMAAGIADNLLLATYLACDCPVVVCPAMNMRMWRHPAVRTNIEKLRRHGVVIVGPASGSLACGDIGEGRLAPLEEIQQTLEMLLSSDGSSEKKQNSINSKDKDLASMRILISAGATREPIDSVRYITNHSSGKMGYALAEAAHRRGADVTVVSANCLLERNQDIRYVDVTTSAQLSETLESEFESHDVLIMAAAVCDYKVLSKQTTGKLERERINDLQLVPTGDIVQSLGTRCKGKLKIGFAAEFGEHHLDRAREKMRRKNLDMIVFNDISRADIGFESDENELVLITPGREDVLVGKTTKEQCADRILDQMKEIAQ